MIHSSNLLFKHLHLFDSIGVGQGKEDLLTSLGLHIGVVVVAVAPDASGKIHVLFLNSDALGMDSAQVGVLEQAHNVSF